MRHYFKNNSLASTTNKQVRRFVQWRQQHLAHLTVGLAISCLICLSGCFDRAFYITSIQVRFGPTPTDYQYDEVFFESEPGVRLRGLFAHPNQQLLQATSGGKPRGTIVHAHGNAGNSENHLAVTAFLVRSGYQVLVFDYRGYGRSTGAISRKGSLRDTLAAIDYVESRDDVDESKIFLFGQSLGAAVGIVAAAQKPDLKGLILESSFTTYREVAYQALTLVRPLVPLAPFAALLINHGLDPIDYIGQISSPILFIHGENDALIPLSMTQRLYDKANEPKELKTFRPMVHIRGDINLGSEYTFAILSFLDNLVIPKADSNADRTQAERPEMSK